MPGKYDRKDHAYRRAKAEGHLSRAFYKLEEINNKFQIIKPGMAVLDLGAWPGSWLEYAAGRVGSSGYVVGIDLVKIEGLSRPNVQVLCGDIRDPEIITQARLSAGRPFAVILSDLAPKLSGIAEMDRSAALELAEAALSIAVTELAVGGSLVVKVFKGNETEVFIKALRPLFKKSSREELKSTRKTSNEFYIVAGGYQGKTQIEHSL